MFDKFPKINYNFNGKEVEVTDIFRNVKVDFTNFSDYKTAEQPNTRPDQTAATVYDDPNKFWLMFLTNNVNNPFVEWQETAGGQYGIDKTVYDTKVFQFANSSAYRPTNSEYYPKNTTDRYLGVDFSGIQANDIITFEKGDGSFRLKCFGAGQVKTNNNQCGEPHYGQSIIPDNFLNQNGITYISAGDNLSAGLDSIGRIWAWGEDIGLTKSSNFAKNGDLYYSTDSGYLSLDITKNKIIANKTNTLYCYGDGCTGTFPYTAPQSIKKMAFLKGNTYGGVILYNNNKIQIFGGLTATIGLTGYYLLGLSGGGVHPGTTFSDISCTDSACFGITRNLTPYSGYILEFGNPQNKLNYAPNILLHHLNFQIDGRLIEKSTVDKFLYTTKNHSTSTYVRNTNHWTATIAPALGITGIDLTCMSVWNSVSGDKNTATAITPLHAITSHHYNMNVGTVLRFITNDNQVVERTVASIATLNIDNNYTYDWRIVKLNSPLPSSIKPAKIFSASQMINYFPTYWDDYLLQENWRISTYGSSKPLPHYFTKVAGFYTDQEEKGLVSDITYSAEGSYPYKLSPMTSRRPPLSGSLREPYHENWITGDSSSPLFVIVNNELVILGVAWAFNDVGGFLGGENEAKLISLFNQSGPSGYTLLYADLSNFENYNGHEHIYRTPNYKLQAGNNNLLVLNEEKSIRGYGDNSKGQLNFPQKTNYVSMSAGKYHIATTDIHGNLNVYGQIFTNSGGCTGVTVYTAATAAYGSYGAKIASGENHIVALESGKNVKYTGRIVKLDSAMKRMYVRGISASDFVPLYIKDPAGTKVIITNSTGQNIKKIIQHQLRSIDLYKNTSIYVVDQAFTMIDLSANSGQLWNSIFIDNYQDANNNVQFITPFKIQRQKFVDGIKILDLNKLYLLENALEPILGTEKNINIKIKDL